MMVKIRDMGMQIQEFLSTCPPFEPVPSPFVSPSGSVLLHGGVVAPVRGDDLLVIDAFQAREFSNGKPVAPQPIGADDFWDVVFTQPSGQEGRRSFGIAMSLKKNIEHEAILVHRPPEPVSDAIDGSANFIQAPPRTLASPLGGAVLR
ncbi:hypothetical protein HNQ08_003740 [Deinococcus humi]|uniref:Uncharacterized protein n=1 Tax=Deinococcus humi TaxID=662880 RepID=A0A7W8JWP7_9DEIO|nr:hypothetical protein [Deinococcus humi]